MREHYESKSLTAIAIAAHEVEHAIQDQQGDKRLGTRIKMIPIANKVARWSVAIISLSPIIGIVAHHPMPFSLLLFLGLGELKSSNFLLFSKIRVAKFKSFFTNSTIYNVI